MALPQKKLARIPSVVGGRPMPTSGSLHKQQASTSGSSNSTTSAYSNNNNNNSTERNFPELVSPMPQKPLPTVSNDISRALENQENDQYPSSDTQSWYVGDDDNNLSIAVPQQYQYQYQNQNQQSQQAAFYSQSTNSQQYRSIPMIDENRQSQYTQQPGRVSLDINRADQHPEPRRGHYSAPASPILNVNNEQFNRGGPNVYNEQFNQGGPNVYNEQFNQGLSKPEPPTLTLVTNPNILAANGQYPGQVYASNANYSQASWNPQQNAQQNGQYAPITRPLSQGSTPSRQSSYHLRVPSPSGFSSGPQIGPDRVSFYGNPDRYSGIKSPNTSALRLQIDDTNAKRMTMTSFTLASDEKARERYRDAARKSNNPILQVEYAKFLIGMSDVYVTADTTQDGPPLNTNDTYTKLVEEAVYWIDKLSSKNQPEASYIKGTWHEYGKFGKEQSTEKALKFYNSSSKLDHPKANFKVGEYYEHQRNSGRALSFYQKAASLGDVSAFYRLALSFMLGDLKQDVNYKQALIYLKQAATKANEDCPEGAYVYGMILAKEYTKAHVPDELVVPDEREAKELIQKAANLGHVAALYKMGHCHEYATFGCSYDPVLSVSYYKRAADKGNFEAHMALSKWYLCGAEGYFDQNEALAYEHAEKAAKGGLSAAEFAMGYFHEVGINVPLDMTVANVWYSKAAGHGNTDAKQRIERGGTITRREHELQQTKLKKQRKDKNEKDCIIM